MNALNKLLTTISEAPESQIHPEICKKIKGLIGCPPEIVAFNLKEIRDQCVAEALASGFALNVISETINIAETQ